MKISTIFLGVNIIIIAGVIWMVTPMEAKVYNQDIMWMWKLNVKEGMLYLWGLFVGILIGKIK